MRRDAGLLLLARVVSAGTTVAVLALIARTLGPDALGAVGVGFAAGAIGAALSDLGTTSLLVRESARRPDVAGLYLGTGLLVRVLTMPVALVAIALVGGAIASDRAVVIVLAAAGLMVQQTAEVTRSVFVARQRMAIAAAHAVIENLAWFGVIVAGVLAGAPLEAIFAWGLVVWILSVLAGVTLARTLADVRPRLARGRALADMAAQAGPFAAFAIVGIAYARLDPLLIGLLASGPALATAGSYFAAARLMAAFEYLPDAVSRASLPELSKRAATDAAAAVPLLRSAAGLLLAVGLAVPAVIVPSSGLIMGALFNVDPIREGWVLGGLACIVPIRYLGYLFGVTLTSTDAQGLRVAAGGSALAVVLLVDVIGIPRFGLLAPIAGAAVASATVLTIYARFVHIRFGSVGIGPSEGARLVAAGLVAVAIGIGVARAAHPVAGSAAGALAYVTLLAVLPRGGRQGSAGATGAARRILFVHPSDEGYGADRILLQLATGLAAKGYEPLVLLPEDAAPGWLSEQLVAAGVPVERCELAVARRRYLRLAGLPGYIRAVARARSRVREAAVRHRADIIHVNTSALLVGAVVGRPRGARLVWHVHEIVLDPRPLAWVFRLVPSLTGDLVIAVSEAVRRHLTPGGFRAGRVVTVHNGLPPRDPAPNEAVARRAQTGPVVAFVGRINRWKGHEVFVTAAALVGARFPATRYVIAGDAPTGESERESRLREQITAAGLDDRIAVMGNVADGAGVFDAAQIAVCPSTLPDPFPTVILEAMRAGCAVVASNQGGAPEMIEPGVSGLLVPPRDAVALSGAIVDLLEDPERRIRIGRAAQLRVAAAFSVPAMLDRLVAAYDRLAR